MAASSKTGDNGVDEGSEVITLSSIFDKCVNLHDSLDDTSYPSHSKEYQEVQTNCEVYQQHSSCEIFISVGDGKATLYCDSVKYQNDSKKKRINDIVKKGISLLEEATKMVNEISMFASNEVIDEIATADIKYLLLPALLGNLSLKLAAIDTNSRLESINLGELYFRDFLQRCKDYKICNIELPESDLERNKNSSPSKPKSEILHSTNISTMAKERENKIKQYKMLKELEQRQKELKAMMEKQNADEVVREYYLVMLKKWTTTALQELESIKMERSVLEFRSEMKPESKTNKKETKSNSKPLKPIIITKNELQKKVFGIGYPSIPAMTVDEFYKQRYGEVKAEVTPMGISSLQQMAANPERAAREIEKEDEEEEQKIENDDIEKLQRMREWDDWKDDNRRGSGNKKNMG